MQTPTITKTQRKSTLSGKKTKTKQTIKNIIATPYNNVYWPLISPEDHSILKIVLEDNLPKVKPVKVNVPWKLLKNIPRSDRKKFRNEYAKTDELEINKMDREGLTFGVNAVTKLLEKNLLSVVLVTSNVEKIMIQHIIDGAVLYRVPIIVFDDLRRLLFEVCGISSSVISISKNINLESRLNLIKESVVQIFEKYPAPLDHINYDRSRKNVSSTEISQQMEDGNSNVLELASELNSDVESTIYLKRESKYKRVFIPENSEKNVNIHRMEVDSIGFLPFSKTSTYEPENNRNGTSYKSLVIKRLKGDGNRNKRKIRSLKRKLH